MNIKQAINALEENNKQAYMIQGLLSQIVDHLHGPRPEKESSTTGSVGPDTILNNLENSTVRLHQTLNSIEGYTNQIAEAIGIYDGPIRGAEANVLGSKRDRG